MSKLTTMTQDLTLPSKGYLNPEIPEGKVTQRCMMVADQKYLAGSSGNNVQRLIEATITEPSNFDVTKITPADTLYLLMSLRSLSYGKTYRFQYRCPKCNSVEEISLDLSELEVEDLEEDYAETLTVELPNTGDIVYTRLLTNGDYKKIEDELQRIRKRANDVDGMRYILRLSRMITKIVLKEKNDQGESEITDPIDIRNYVTDLTDYDATAILSTVQDIKYGVVPTIEYTCSHCGRILDVPIQFDSEFFRPRYDSRPR